MAVGFRAGPALPRWQAGRPRPPVSSPSPHPNLRAFQRPLRAGHRRVQSAPTASRRASATVVGSRYLFIQLVDKSLLAAAEGDGEQRYHLLETVHAYAAERLTETGQRTALEARRRLFFTGLADLAQTQAMGAHQAWWLRRLDQDFGNLRGALDGAFNCGDVATGMRLAVALWRFWDMRGLVSEAAYWLEKLLARQREAPLAQQAALLSVAMRADLRQGELDRARQRGEQALALFRDLDRQPDVAETLLTLGVIAGMQDLYYQALIAFEEALALYRRLGMRRGVASALTNIGYALVYQGEHARGGAPHGGLDDLP